MADLKEQCGILIVKALNSVTRWKRRITAGSRSFRRLVFAITILLYKRLSMLIEHFTGDFIKDEETNSIEDEEVINN